MANIDRPSFNTALSSVSEFSSVEKANQYCDFLRTEQDKHAPPSLRKVITRNSYPWFESIRYELFIAKRERREAKRKWRNIKLTIFLVYWHIVCLSWNTFSKCPRIYFAYLFTMIVQPKPRPPVPGTRKRGGAKNLLVKKIKKYKTLITKKQLLLHGT